MNTVLRRKIKHIIFSIIQPLFVRNVDYNEDFVCMMCSEPVLRRTLTCSEECWKQYNAWINGATNGA